MRSGSAPRRGSTTSSPSAFHKSLRRALERFVLITTKKDLSYPEATLSIPAPSPADHFYLSVEMSSSSSSSSSSAARAPLDDDVYFNPATAGLSACGLHCTIDYPRKDDEHWLRDTVVQRGSRG